MKKITLLILSGLILYSCSNNQYESNKNKRKEMETSDITDVHSYAQFDKAYTSHLYLELNADFDKKVLSGVAAHTIQNNNATEIVFDI
ncbi:MAG: PBP1b-binding outer membrane lipoprotein LpoB, partial [Flavobacteriales bacterium]